jgi:hypothetical protein
VHHCQSPANFPTINEDQIDITLCNIRTRGNVLSQELGRIQDGTRGGIGNAGKDIDAIKGRGSDAPGDIARTFRIIQGTRIGKGEGTFGGVVKPVHKAIGTVVVVVGHG